ncbi:unnamed protein product [Caretta caretta]
MGRCRSLPERYLLEGKIFSPQSPEWAMAPGISPHIVSLIPDLGRPPPGLERVVQSSSHTEFLLRLSAGMEAVNLGWSNGHKATFQADAPNASGGSNCSFLAALNQCHPAMVSMDHWQAQQQPTAYGKSRVRFRTTRPLPRTQSAHVPN